MRISAAMDVIGELVVLCVLCAGALTALGRGVLVVYGTAILAVSAARVLSSRRERGRGNVSGI